MSKYNHTKKYWLQLQENWFDEDSIRWLEDQENGTEYSLFYLKLMLKSIKTDGFLIRQVGKMLVPYEPKALAKLTNTKFDTVVVGLELFKQIGLIQVLEDGAIYIEQVKKLTSSRTLGAEERRIQRLKQSADNLPTNVGQMSPIYITKDKDIYKERDIPRARTHARESKLSLSQKKFKDAFSKKTIDCDITDEYDVDLLIQKINESEWLKMLTQPLSWYLKNYNEILADKYKTVNGSKKNTQTKNKVIKSEYSKEELNRLYTPIDEVEI